MGCLDQKCEILHFFMKFLIETFPWQTSRLTNPQDRCWRRTTSWPYQPGSLQPPHRWQPRLWPWPRWWTWRWGPPRRRWGSPWSSRSRPGSGSPSSRTGTGGPRGRCRWQCTSSCSSTNVPDILYTLCELHKSNVALQFLYTLSLQQYQSVTEEGVNKLLQGQG